MQAKARENNNFISSLPSTDAGLRVDGPSCVGKFLPSKVHINYSPSSRWRTAKHTAAADAISTRSRNKQRCDPGTRCSCPAILGDPETLPCTGPVAGEETESLKLFVFDSNSYTPRKNTTAGYHSLLCGPCYSSGIRLHGQFSRCYCQSAVIFLGPHSGINPSPANLTSYSKRV